MNSTVSVRMRNRELELESLRNNLIIELYTEPSNDRGMEINREINDIERELSDIRLTLYVKMGGEALEK